MTAPRVAREAGSAVLYLIVEAAWSLLDRLLPQDQPRDPQWGPGQDKGRDEATRRHDEQVRTQWMTDKQAERSKP
jgi:hypothetical protein